MWQLLLWFSGDAPPYSGPTPNILSQSGGPKDGGFEEQIVGPGGEGAYG